MEDRDRATKARTHLHEMATGEHENEEVRDSYRQALTAVETLIDQLSEATTGRDRSESPAEPPDNWEDDKDWEEALGSAYEKAGIDRSTGTITTKTIDDRDYYYLQWREGDAVKSQYVGPVTPA
ncbi:hypothetical protein [Haloarcula sp. JP-L23]|uniref:hypothetical protein n=1 Tax=Haloarcula sp. JP-L23 TaxID=2716717 RepID=UPI00140EEC6F|nr:hypothetical protein G9465_20925 [Haloarcula sp. JP-L23]